MAQNKDKVRIYLEKDRNSDKEEVARLYQIDGNYYQVKVGQSVEVPRQLAEEMLRVGDIEHFDD